MTLPDPDSVLFFDCETTGLVDWRAPELDPRQPWLVQLGARLGGTALRLLVRPPDEMTEEAWAEAQQKAHGISLERARRDGVNPAEALRVLRQAAARAQAVCAHNLDFDALIVRIAALRAGLDPAETFGGLPGYCTKLMSTSLCQIPSGRRGFKWPSLQEAHLILCGCPARGTGEAHDALDDVEACRRVYGEIVQRIARGTAPDKR